MVRLLIEDIERSEKIIAKDVKTAKSIFVKSIKVAEKKLKEKNGDSVHDAWKAITEIENFLEKLAQKISDLSLEYDKKEM